ncbi:efflux RND transporter periplasmic adaptor subunit [Tautonia plasticadhaerens]|uniref:Cobalt-zinc-cadmium resistance protein CzcB n=1 Tax=Tautonia plasticadhaerens TaxID=2527974 RepID=A0A518H1J6_9BACT|nr:efflux RND transporter periplasmic adaptor subunit [Tautonia plasticadhaerens]QDV34714.1 Cobalt-zinc-cadmium resistance protein CzcB [Tautonia plasticadhaerens]
MRRTPRPPATGRPPGLARPASCLLAAIALAVGCDSTPEPSYTSVSKPPTVRVVRPEARDITRVVGQPSFIEAYERTSIYPKMTAYIEEWIVDIGDRVKKGDVLATLFVPEIVEELNSKKATVALDRERIELAGKMVDVAEADVKAAQAHLDETKAILAKYQAEVDRWASEVDRLQKETDRGVVAPQILLESTNQLKSSTAARDAAQASIQNADAELLSEQAELAKAKVDVKVAEAALAVAQSEEKKWEAWVGYLTLAAPFDGVIVARNANTFDFVLPSTGDPTADKNAPKLSPSGAAAPIYVVDRTDVVRIFVDIPESDAIFVKDGAKASILVRAFRDEPLEGSVTRTSWALNVTSRTLRAEIDLPNTDGQLLPGMYAYAEVKIDRPGVRALPTDALVREGAQSYCWILQDGRATRAEVRTGISDGAWVEVTNRRHAPGPDGDGDWTPIDGSEQVILGDLSVLSDGQDVEVAPQSKPSTVAQAPPPGPTEDGTGSGASSLDPDA